MAVTAFGGEKHHGGSSSGTCSLRKAQREEPSCSPAGVQQHRTYTSLLRTALSICLFKITAGRDVWRQNTESTCAKL